MTAIRKHVDEHNSTMNERESKTEIRVEDLEYNPRKRLRPNRPILQKAGLTPEVKKKWQSNITQSTRTEKLSEYQSKCENENLSV